MTHEEVMNMIFNILNEKIEQLGGEDTLIKAAVWKWWTQQSFSNVQELELALAEFFGGDYEDSFNLPS